MSLNDFKIKQSDITTKGVTAAPDVLSGTAEENKRIFDRLIREAVMLYYNSLIDELQAQGVEQILRRGDDSVLYLRVDDEDRLEASVDGVSYKTVGSDGHLIYDKDNVQLAKRNKMRFMNSEIVDNGHSLEIHTKPDWSEIRNKPLVAEETEVFRWYAGYEPIARITNDDLGDEGAGHYKVSSTPLTAAQLAKCVVSFRKADGAEGTVQLNEDMIDSFNDGTAFVVSLYDYVDIYLGVTITSVTEGAFEIATGQMTPGVWVEYSDAGVGDTITGIVLRENEKLDKALLPAIETEDLPPIPWQLIEEKPFGDMVYEDSALLYTLPVAFTAPTLAGDYDFCKLSDRALTPAQLRKTVFTATLKDSATATIEEDGAVAAQTEQYTHFYLGTFPQIKGGSGLMEDYPWLAVYTAGEITLNGTAVTVPEPGLYIGSLPGMGFEIYIESSLGGSWTTYNLGMAFRCEEVKKLDEKYLPDRDTDEVRFETDLITTFEIGNIALENGKAIIPAEGKTITEVWDTIFVSEQNPEIVDPAVTVSAPQCKAYEVGTKVTPTYAASLSAGRYEYGPDTGIVATAWAVSSTNGETLDTAEGAFSEITVEDDTAYRITAVATHGAGAVPVTNLGNDYPDGRIAAGEKEAVSKAITGYRNGFYGTASDKTAVIDSAFVRTLTKSGKAPAAGNVWSLDVPVGAMRISFAYPATIRDVSSVLDVNGLNAEIKTAFTLHTVAVEGANGYEGIGYKVYVLDRANAAPEANTFKITI